MENGRFILASSSPRRIELLRDAGFAFDIEPADIDESAVPDGLIPRDLAIFLARSKARATAARHWQENDTRVVLGADTVVAVGAELFAKAETHQEARAMLQRLAGTRQSVITGVAVVRTPDRSEYADAVESIVEMKLMTSLEIDAYVASEQWRGKAGAYGIQDHDPQNDPFVRLVSGNLDNVVGLPVALAASLLQAAGIVRRVRP